MQTARVRLRGFFVPTWRDAAAASALAGGMLPRGEKPNTCVAAQGRSKSRMSGGFGGRVARCIA